MDNDLQYTLNCNFSYFKNALVSEKKTEFSFYEIRKVMKLHWFDFFSCPGGLSIICLSV